MGEIKQSPGARLKPGHKVAALRAAASIFPAFFLGLKPEANKGLRYAPLLCAIVSPSPIKGRVKQTAVLLAEDLSS
ncbi:MAG: hypothetical protein EOO15_05435 [Chitinophagaceae bacterium]|nr:MAG: hypothetical protein EOO15_05435 [Chitinophagaceae bacterium]